MSTVKVNAITDASGGNTATINSMTPTADSLQGFRNRIINGDMRIDQRNAGAAVTSGGAYGVDRFKVVERSGYSTLSVNAQQSTDVPSNFTNSTKITVATGQAVSSSGYLISVDQRIEGFNFADLGFGTSAAKSFTLSFWVKSSLTGTYPVSFFNSAVNRAYLGTYTISSANTWEYKTVTVAGDTSGTWLTDSGVGIGIQFAIAVGSSDHGTAGSWSGTYRRGVSGMPDVGATTNNTFFITGVQLEVGSTATPFERRPYGTELMLCQRYCYSIFANQAADSYARYGIGDCRATTVLESFNYLPVVMRARPSVTTTGTASNYGVYSAGSITACSAVPAIGDATTYGIAFLISTVASGLTAGRAGQLLSNNNTTSYLIFAAEL